MFVDFHPHFKMKLVNEDVFSQSRIPPLRKHLCQHIPPISRHDSADFLCFSPNTKFILHDRTTQSFELWVIYWDPYKNRCLALILTKTPTLHRRPSEATSLVCESCLWVISKAKEQPLSWQPSPLTPVSVAFTVTNYPFHSSIKLPLARIIIQSDNVP